MLSSGRVYYALESTHYTQFEVEELRFSLQRQCLERTRVLDLVARIVSAQGLTLVIMFDILPIIYCMFV